MSLPEDSLLAPLLRSFPRVGTVRWIGLRGAPRAPVTVVEQAFAVAGRGLEGDHRRRTGKREVTLVQHEHLDVIARLAGLSSVAPEVLRRNLVVAGIPLLALVGARFRIGEALFEGSGPCPPCSRMEQALGPGGYNALRGHGGITARILESGRIGVGAPVMFTCMA